ncbi:hypothetical protein ACFPM0_25240 [Pseudonocardia sulfidoxydans]|uniref:hypothetical protein n=1 Tax=Pseudonocardia sulfidoxydans TaxID=54011 RepID=UPI0036166173
MAGDRCRVGGWGIAENPTVDSTGRETHGRCRVGSSRDPRRRDTARLSTQTKPMHILVAIAHRLHQGWLGFIPIGQATRVGPRPAEP